MIKGFDVLEQKKHKRQLNRLPDSGYYLED